VITSSVNGRQVVVRELMPRRHPPTTAGIQPDFALRALSHLTA